MRILFLSAWFPFPPNNGSKLRIYHLLRGLAAAHQVSLISFVDGDEAAVHAPELAQICDQVQVVPRPSFRPDSWTARLGFLHWKPRSVIDTYSPKMAACIEKTLADGRYDLIISSQTMMAGYANHFGDTAALFEEIEIALLYEQFAYADGWPGRLRHGLTWLKHRRYVADLMPHFGAGTVVSEKERSLLTKTVNARHPVEVIPNCVDVAGYRSVTAPPRPNSLIFTGAFSYYVNYDAMVWFLQHVYQRVQSAVPDVSLTITGDHANRPLPPATGVTLTGFVDDVRPLIASSSVSLAPILEGGGTRLKILEAMALGTPVVATSKGAEGLAAENGRHLLLADTPQAFAEAVVHLLQDPALRRRLADSAYQLVSEQYDWTAVMPRFLQLVETIASPQN